MDLIPAFEIGLWNAWIFCLSVQIAGITVISLINRKALKKVTAVPQLNKKEKINGVIENVLYWSLLIYTIFVPLKIGTLWFYTGLPISLLAAIMYITALVNYATTPLDAPAIKGMYRISRNPVYFSAYLLFIGAGIASASWVLLLGTILWIIMDRFHIITEERFCLEKYGDVYREYKNRVPRYIGIPKKEAEKC